MNKKFISFIILSFLILIIGLGSWGLTESSEARYAQIAKEMMDSGNYIEPTQLGIKHFHKPPLTYYITVLGYHLFGINEFGARFFLQIALITQLILVYLLGKLLFKKEEIAVAASIIYFSFPIVLLSVRNLTTDAYLNTFILASIYFWFQYRVASKPIFLYLFYLFLGLIFETKGPVGLLIPLVFIITLKIIRKEKIQLHLHQYLGILLFLLISSSWFLLLISKNEGVLNYFINHQIVDRVSVDKFNRGEPFYYYLMFIPLIGMPLIFLFLENWVSRFKQLYKDKSYEFALLVSVLIFMLILSLSTSKLILYILPIFSILALLLAKFYYDISERLIRVFIKLYYVLFGLILVSPIILKFFPSPIKTNVYFSIALLLIVGLGLFVISKNKKSTNHLKLLYIAILFIVTLIVESTMFFHYNENTVNSVKPIATFIKSKTETQPKTIIVYDRLLPSLSFYLNQPIITIHNGRYTTKRETVFETDLRWKKTTINYAVKKDRQNILNLASKTNLYLIIRERAVVPDTLTHLKNKLMHSKKIGKYTVYY